MQKWDQQNPKRRKREVAPKNLGIACEDDIPAPIKNYMEILKKFFGIEVEHLLNDANLKF